MFHQVLLYFHRLLLLLHLHPGSHQGADLPCSDPSDPAAGRQRDRSQDPRQLHGTQLPGCHRLHRDHEQLLRYHRHDLRCSDLCGPRDHREGDH